MNAKIIVACTVLAVLSTQAMQEAMYSTVKFINNTRSDINVRTFWESGKETPAITVPAESLLPKAAPGITLENQNLDEIKEYLVTYTMGGISKLTINPRKLGQLLAQHNSDSIDIVISKKPYGFRVEYMPLKRGSLTPGMVALSESIMGVEPSISPSGERRLLYSELGLSPEALAHEVLGLPAPPEVKETIELLKNPVVVKYRKLLEDTYKRRYEDLFYGSIPRDIEMKKRYGISDFTAKQQQIVLHAYETLKKQIKAT